MTTPTRIPDRPQIVSQHTACSVCHKEIPLSAAFTPEGADYVGHFCGSECYEEFAARHKQRTQIKLPR